MVAELGRALCLGLLLLLVLRTSGAAGALTEEEFLNDKERKVRLLAGHALFLQVAAEANDCGISNCVDKCSRHSCSPTRKDNFTCAQAPRRVVDCEKSDNDNNETCMNLNVDFGGNGFVRIPPQFQNFADLSPEVTRSICSQSNLQFPASSVTVFTELTFWNYFGSAEGVWRTFPGREADPNNGCIQYDPRKRPWYILATSVVKDLVVLLDNGQRNETTFSLSKNIISELLCTILDDDSINVATFNSNNATLLRDSSLRVIINDNVPSYFDISAVTNSPNGFSNISQGFDIARMTFNSSSKLKMIVVLTDGNFVNNGAYNNSALQQAVSSLRSEGVVLFFFSLGPGNDDNPPDPLTELRSLSCQMNSSVTYVSLSDAERNPLWAVRPYFDYQATLRFNANTTFWTDAYEDFDGLGLVSTVTYPVFKDGTLYGVAGIDVVVNSSELINAIRQRFTEAHVPSMALACQLEQVNLSKCTKPVDPSIRALCPQNMYTDEKPADVYLKNLCCSTCDFEFPTRNDENRLALLLGLISAAAVILVLVSVVAFLAFKNRVTRALLREIQEDFARECISTYLFTYKELKAATRKFHKDNKLGEGGFGEVYQGKCKDGSQIAVKKLSDDSKQGKREFLNEVMVISKVQHRNLVKLRGCCIEGRHRLLVYEYLEKKSLRQTLLGGPREAIDIGWPNRLNIAIGTARGLAYLHDELQPRIIHRDIKASNILLDCNLDAKIADFGLAKLFPEEKSHFTTVVAGTMGYLAPEYVTRGQLTEKVDVFSYGVLLMEIVTGKVNMSRTLSGSMLFLVDEIRRTYKESHESSDEVKLLELVDPKLDGRFAKEEAVRLVKISLLCTNECPISRPSISQVVLMLLGTQEIPEYLLKHLLVVEYSRQRTSMHFARDGSNLDWSEDDATPPLLSEQSSEMRKEPCP